MPLGPPLQTEPKVELFEPVASSFECIQRGVSNNLCGFGEEVHVHPKPVHASLMANLAFFLSAAKEKKRGRQASFPIFPSESFMPSAWLRLCDFVVPLRLRRITIALCIAFPVLLLLYNPFVAAVTIWAICMVAAYEHATLRLSALQRLAGRCTSAGTEQVTQGGDGEIDNPSAALTPLEAAYKSPLLLMACCSLLFVAEVFDANVTPGMSFFLVAACVSFGVPAVSVLTYARHPEIPESRDALLYAWASAGLDVYFLWHYAVPLSLGSFILRRRGGLPLAASVIAVSAASDSGALFFGSAFGKRRVMQRLSPSKTLAGVLGSLVWSLSAAGFLWHLSLNYKALGLLPLSLGNYLIVGAIISCVGFGGDVVESAYKRCAGVKDSSGLFGPHGGVLDRLDSLALPIPFLAAYLEPKGFL
ncbi:hypothetical protein Esti_000272 [Eimeria stiedai]